MKTEKIVRKFEEKLQETDDNWSKAVEQTVEELDLEMEDFDRDVKIVCALRSRIMHDTLEEAADKAADELKEKL